MSKPKPLLILASALGACLVGTPAHALVADGITFTLTDQFDLHISGFNSASDIEGGTAAGRSGVNAFAFDDPANFSTATPPSGFTLAGTGLNANGCNTSSASQFCFRNDGFPLPSTPPLNPNTPSILFLT